MSEDRSHTDADTLRRAFDASFQEPPDESVAASEVMLAVRAGGLRIALPLEMLGGLRRRPKVTPVPSQDATLVGLGGFRGEVVGLHALAALLGADVPAERAVDERAWVAFDRSGAIGLLFAELEGQLRLTAADFRPLPDAAPEAVCRRVAVVGADRWLVVDVAGLLSPVASSARDIVKGG